MIKIRILSVRSPKWTDNSRARIDCLIRTNYLDNEHPFTADPNDVEPHGREIFERCRAGEFGPIGEPECRPEDVPPPNIEFAEWVAAWPEIHDFLAEANEENARGTVRGVVLVWGAMLDTVLGRYLDEHIKRNGLSKSELKRTYSKDIATFGGAIYVAHQLKIIDEGTFNSLESIRQIRNACAHRWRLSLDDPEWMDEIIPHFRQLHAKFWFDQIFRYELEYLARMIYSAACGQIAIQISEKIVNASG